MKFHKVNVYFFFLFIFFFFNWRNREKKVSLPTFNLLSFFFASTLIRISVKCVKYVLEDPHKNERRITFNFSLTLFGVDDYDDDDYDSSPHISSVLLERSMIGCMSIQLYFHIHHLFYFSSIKERRWNKKKIIK